MENTKSPPYIIISKLAFLRWEIIDNNNNKISQKIRPIYVYPQQKYKYKELLS